jgi:plasmid segregation protein ParM
MMEKIVRAIDVGYGNTKICFGDEDAHSFRCDYFPSIASLYNGVDKGAGVMAKQDLMEVESDGKQYLVGKDVRNTLSARDDQGRTLLTNYIDTPQHMALLRGGLAYLGEENIDLLVSGLPVSNLKYKDRMIEKLKGIHQYPDGKEIHVKNVYVIPQPVGGFINYFHNHPDTDIQDLMSLTIDVGYFTLDWVVCNGLKIQGERTGSCPGGMSLVIEKICELIGEERRVPFSDFHMVDKGIRNGFKTRIQGKPYTFSHFVPKIEAYIEHSVQSMLSSVGSLDDIDVIVLVGGGSRCYRPVIERLLNGREIIVPDDTICANVKGFYLAGKQVVNR